MPVPSRTMLSLGRASPFVASLLLLALGMGACTGSGPPPPRPAGGAPAAIPPLGIRIAKVAGVALKGRPARGPLLGPAERVRDTISRMYTAGFVDPAQWRAGFPVVLDAFAPEMRGAARADLRELTLGTSARSLTSMLPTDARIVVRFLPNERRNPVAAMADMRFKGIATAEDGTEMEVRHEADYLLEALNDRWLITGYRVQQRLVPQPLPRRDPLFILAIGSDARPHKPVERALADSLHIIGVNPKTGVASILGIPRDSYVPIPGAGTQKINASLFHGGPQLTVQTVEKLAGIRIDGYLLVGFEGFRRMVSDVGGVAMTIPEPASDFYSGAHFRAGPTRLDGPEALAFSRNRHDVRGGDFGRSLNQGKLLIAALREFREDVRKDPAAAFTWLLAGAKYLDTDLSFTEMIRLAFSALAVDKVKNRVVSGSGGFAGSASVVRLGSAAQAMFRDLARDGTL